MPIYEYRCPDNGRTVEVRHGMNEVLTRWGDVARRAGIDPGPTPPDAPVERLMSAPVPLTATSHGGGETPAPRAPCGPGCACAGLD